MYPAASGPTLSRGGTIRRPPVRSGPVGLATAPSEPAPESRQACPPPMSETALRPAPAATCPDRRAAPPVRRWWRSHESCGGIPDAAVRFRVRLRSWARDGAIRSGCRADDRTARRHWMAPVDRPTPVPSPVLPFAAPVLSPSAPHPASITWHIAQLFHGPFTWTPVEGTPFAIVG